MESIEGKKVLVVGVEHNVTKLVVMRLRNYKIFVGVLIVINIVTSIIIDNRWAHSMYGLPQRKFDEQMKNILPRDNIDKFVYVPNRQRPFYQGILTFSDIFEGDQKNYIYMDPEEFVTALKKSNPPADHVYFLITEGKPGFKIYDYSYRIRATSYEELSPLLITLTKELTPSPTYFFL